MSKYKITIEEHISQTFEVDAADMEEAMQIATDKYNAGEFVVEPNTPTAKLMCAENAETNETTEWVEF